MGCDTGMVLVYVIQQLNVLLYNTLNSSLTYYIEIRQAAIESIIQ